MCPDDLEKMDEAKKTDRVSGQVENIVSWQNWKVIPDYNKPIGQWKVEIPKEEIPIVIKYIENYLHWFVTEALPFLIKRFAN